MGSQRRPRSRAAPTQLCASRGRRCASSNLCRSPLVPCRGPWNRAAEIKAGTKHRVAFVACCPRRSTCCGASMLAAAARHARAASLAPGQPYPRTAGSYRLQLGSGRSDRRGTLTMNTNHYKRLRVEYLRVVPLTVVVRYETGSRHPGARIRKVDLVHTQPLRAARLSAV